MEEKIESEAGETEGLDVKDVEGEKVVEETPEEAPKADNEVTDTTEVTEDIKLQEDCSNDLVENVEEAKEEQTVDQEEDKSEVVEIKNVEESVEAEEEKASSEDKVDEDEHEDERSQASTLELEKEEDEPDFVEKRKSRTLESPEKSSESVNESISSKTEDEEKDKEFRMQERFLTVRQMLRIANAKNAFLNRQLIEHFKSKKMEYALEGPKEARKLNARLSDEYNKKMEAFHALLEGIFRERQEMEEKLENLAIEHAEKSEELNVLTNLWLQRQKDVGSGLIYAKTGKPLSDKHISDSIKQQRLHLDMMQQLRNKLIKLERKIADVGDEMKKMDVDENVHLIQYEELKMENIGFLEKIEERNEETDRLRRRCEGAIQTLSHVKEKSSGHDTDIVYLTKKLEELDEVFTTEREKLNDLKRKRDYYRNASNKLYLDSGLLMQPKLLRDMEAATNEHKTKVEQLNRLKEENETTAKRIRAIRKNIEQSVVELQEKSGIKSRTSMN